MLTFQSNAEKWGNECDQIYAFNWDTDTILENEPQLISNDLGRTTCAYFMPGDTTILMPVLSPEIPHVQQYQSAAKVTPTSGLSIQISIFT